MIWIWVVAIIALLFFFLLVYRMGYRRGYKRGAVTILNEWKHYMRQMEDVFNDQ